MSGISPLYNRPVLPNTQIHRGDILTLVGRTQDIAAATKDLGVPDWPSDIADVTFIAGAIRLGALIGALVWKVSGVPITLSTAGGALISGLVFGWVRSIHPSFGGVPSSTGRTVGERVPGGIALHITNEDLANAANVTPFTASRLISEWQRNAPS